MENTIVQLSKYVITFLDNRLYVKYDVLPGIRLSFSIFHVFSLSPVPYFPEALYLEGETPNFFLNT